MKKLLFFTVMAFFSIFLAACAGSGGSDSPEDVAVNFVEAMYEGKADEAYNMLYLPKDEIQKPGVEEIIRGKIKQGVAQAEKRADENDGIKSVRAEKSEISEDKQNGRVWVVTEFNDADAKTETDRVKVIQVDGKWKVNI